MVDSEPSRVKDEDEEPDEGKRRKKKKQIEVSTRLTTRIRRAKMAKRRA